MLTYDEWVKENKHWVEEIVHNIYKTTTLMDFKKKWKYI
jgi:hypothetical protein